MMVIGTMKMEIEFKGGKIMTYINKEALAVIEQKLKQGKRIELEYNHQTDEIKILEHKITRIKLENKG